MRYDAFDAPFLTSEEVCRGPFAFSVYVGFPATSEAELSVHVYSKRLGDVCASSTNTHSTTVTNLDCVRLEPASVRRRLGYNPGHDGLSARSARFTSLSNNFRTIRLVFVCSSKTNRTSTCQTRGRSREVERCRRSSTVLIRRLEKCTRGIPARRTI